MVWEILLGLVYGAIGFYLLTRPVAGLESVTFALAIYLFLEGALELALSFLIRSLPGSGWLVIDGIITLVLAGMIWSTWPSSEWVGCRHDRRHQHVVQRDEPADALLWRTPHPGMSGVGVLPK